MGEMTRSDPEQLRAAIKHLLEHTDEAVRLPDALRLGGSEESHARAIQEAATELLERHDSDSDSDSERHGSV